MQAPRGVDDDDVAASRRARSIASYATAAGSPPRSPSTNSAPARRPDAELLLRGRAERVGRRDDDGVPVLAQPVRELADRRRLAGAVDADDEHDARLAGKVDARRLAEKRRDLRGERLVQVADVAARLEPAHELRGRGDADVAGDQGFLEPLPRGGVTRIEGAAASSSVSARRLGRASRAGARKGPSAAPHSPVRPRVAEQLSPGACHGAKP